MFISENWSEILPVVFTENSAGWPWLNTSGKLRKRLLTRSKSAPSMTLSNPGPEREKLDISSRYKRMERNASCDPLDTRIRMASRTDDFPALFLPVIRLTFPKAGMVSSEKPRNPRIVRLSMSSFMWMNASLPRHMGRLERGLLPCLYLV